VITAAGVIFAASMFGMLFASISTLVQCGFIIGTGLLLDTFLVRTITVPAIAVLVGKWNWWPSKPPPPVKHERAVRPPEPTQAPPAALAEPEPEPEPEPVAEAAPAAGAQLLARAEPTLAAVVEPVAVAEHVADIKPQVEAELVADSERTPEAQPEPAAEVEPTLEVEPVADIEPTAEVEPVAPAWPVPVAEVVPTTEALRGAHAAPEPWADVKRTPVAEPEFETQLVDETPVRNGNGAEVTNGKHSHTVVLHW
jgi:hypothetical protein